MPRMAGVAIVLFSDLVDSTALLARLGDDRMELVRRAHVEDVTAAVAVGGGRVVKTLGDGAMASFDSALGALRAAAEIQAAVERLDAAQGGVGVAARVGVAAGEPIAHGEDLHGMTVVIANRLAAAAGTGEVLVQDLVVALVASRDGVSLEVPDGYELKGVPDPVRASRLHWRDLATPPHAGAESSEDEASIRGPVRMPPALAAYAEEPLIGRDREIEALRKASAAGTGRRAVLVLGEPGIGKTRHAAAAAAAAQAEGAVVVLARCPPEPVVAFEPWVRAIGELALSGDDSWRSELAAAAGPELATLVPELNEHSTLADRAAADEVIAAEGARYRLLRGVGAALACAAGESPLHVVLDDAHWCDPASAQALAHLLESGPAGLVLVVTARDRELDRGHPVSKVLAELRRTGDVEELRLAGLDASGLAALVGANLGRAISPGLARRLCERTGGNPFFAAELARDLDQRGELREGLELADAPPPEAVADLVEERLGRLSAEAESLLTAAAAIGPTASVALAATVAGIDPEASARALAEGLDEHLVYEPVAAEPAIGFPHALVREALLARGGEAATARVHLAIARALELEGDAEPAELARHFGLAGELAAVDTRIVAHRAAAAAAAAAHDHEQAVEHLQRLLALLPESDSALRGEALVELGEQELLGADLIRARGSFLGAVEAARATIDASLLARAALGFAGGDIGFGWEVGSDDPATAELLREALEVLGDDNPRLSLRIAFRLVYQLVISDSYEEIAALAERAGVLGSSLGDPEALVLARLAAAVALFARSPDPLHVLDVLDEVDELVALAERCDREDLLFRVLQLSAVGHYVNGRAAECDRVLDRAAMIADRLDSPRFGWEVDLNRGLRLLDHGDREGGEALVRRAGAVVRRLRPDIHIAIELVGLLVSEWVFDGVTANSRVAYEATQRAMPRGFIDAFVAFAAALEGDHGYAREAMREMTNDGLERVRQPDGFVPMALWALAFTAAHIGDREMGERLRPLLEPLRGRIIAPVPTVGFGHLGEWHVGRLELLAGRLDAAIISLRTTVETLDECEIAWAQGHARVDLALALHRRGDVAEAAVQLAAGEAIGRRHGVGWTLRAVEEARAEFEGRAPALPRQDAQGQRRLRALAARGGRRALAAMVEGQDDAELERRFADPGKQRTLLRAMAQTFQPAQANGFSGLVAYELQPFAIEPPADAPWRWAMEVDAESGAARLVEPAPLITAVTIHIGLAEWVRVVAGLEDALTPIFAGRCSVEGDVLVAVRLEAMFGGV